MNLPNNSFPLLQCSRLCLTDGKLATLLYGRFHALLLAPTFRRSSSEEESEEEEDKETKVEEVEAKKAENKVILLSNGLASL